MALALPARSRGVSANDVRAVAIVVVSAAAVYLLAGHGIKMIALAAGAAALAVLAAAALRWPGAAMASALFVIAIVPVYWGRPLASNAIVAVPATIAALVLAPAAAPMLRRLRLQSYDYWYLGFVVVLAVAALANVTHPWGASAGLFWRFAIPYVVWRLIALRWLRWDVVLRVLLAAGSVLGALGIYERATGRNVFFTLVPSGYQGGLWAHSIYRNGTIRVEGSFGEPISFGLFLAVCAIAALTILVTADRAAPRLLAAAGIAVMGVAVVDTQSRVALAVLLIGCAVQLVRLWSSRSAARILLVGVVAAVVAVLSPLGGAVEHAMSSTQGNTLEARSAQYRMTVFDVLTTSSSYSLIGHPSTTATGVSDLARTDSGLKSLDNQYAYALTTSGVLGLGAFVGLALALLWSAVSSREREPGARAVGTALAVVVVALLGVALLTQFADFFGIAVALLAATRQREREAA